MNYRNLTATLLLLALGFAICAIFASLLPGAWWQWLAGAALLVVAGAAASNVADEKEVKA